MEHFLTPEQKIRRVAASETFVEMADSDSNFLNKIITGDESWCFQYDPSTKRRTMEWRGCGEGRPTKIRAVKSKIKTMLITFFDSRGIIHREFVPLGQTVNAAFYKSVLERLLARIRRVRPDQYRSGDWFLLHDNAPAHTAILIAQFLARRKVTAITPPPPLFSRPHPRQLFFISKAEKCDERGSFWGCCRHSEKCDTDYELDTGRAV